MADFPPPNARAGEPPITPILVAYALFALSAVMGFLSSGLVALSPLIAITGIIGVIIVYVKRDEARNTWVESHCAWLVRTFWWSIFWDLIAMLAGILLWWVFGLGILLAIGILAATSLWVAYRVIRGYLAFKDSRPIQ